MLTVPCAQTRCVSDGEANRVQWESIRQTPVGERNLIESATKNESLCGRRVVRMEYEVLRIETGASIGPRFWVAVSCP